MSIASEIRSHGPSAYNEEYLMYASLERLKVLAESPLLERIEVIVVDDGSTDQTLRSYVSSSVP